MLNRQGLSLLSKAGSARGASNTKSRLMSDVGAGEGSRMFEQLEQRTMLSFMGPVTPSAIGTSSGSQSGYDTTTIVWNNKNVNVIRNSWVITYTSELGKLEAGQRAEQVAAALGVAPEFANGSVRGRFAELRTAGAITPAMIEQARQQLPWLYNIEPNRVSKKELTPNDARYNEQWALNNTGQNPNGGGVGTVGADIHAQNAWNLSTGSKQSIVAVLDTGVEYNHPDLNANIWRNPGEIPGNNVDDDNNGFIDDIIGWDFAPGNGGNANGDNDPNDADGHGTGVAGVIGAVGNNGIGVSGINWSVSIIPVKIFDDQGNLPDMSAINSLEYVVTLKLRGVDIIATNNSWGVQSEDDTQTYDPALEIAIRGTTDLGVLYVTSAGNTSSNNDGPIFHYPSGYNNDRIITVAATNNKDQLASFSNYGATTVDIAAPGEQILTTARGGGYEYVDGTSFASPQVVGALALMSARNRFATPEQLRDALYSSAEKLPNLNGLTLTGGRLDLHAALLAVSLDGPIVTAVSPGPQTPPTDTITVQFSEDINPATFDVSKIRLVRANNDGIFDSNDITVDLTGATVTLNGKLLTINFPAELVRDYYRLTLDNTGFRDLDGNFLNGDSSSGQDSVYQFNVIIYRGPLETNDSFGQATPVLLDGGGNAVFNDLVIGDGLYEAVDVDMFRIYAPGPSLITVKIDARSLVVPSLLDSYLRLFDGLGQQLAMNDNFDGLDSRIEYFVPAGGFYFVGVSAYPNSSYNPSIPGSGVAGDQTGAYSITFNVLTPGPESISVNNNTLTLLPDISTTESVINIADGRSIADISVRVNILHTYVGDLKITLISPTNAQIVLVDRRGSSGDNFTNTVFDAEAASAITAANAPFTGSFKPEGDLASLYNLPASGKWTLRIQDFSAGNFGQLLSWSMDIAVINDLFGPFELNDSLATAKDANVNGSGSKTFRASIGDGAYGLKDVDLFRMVVSSGSTIHVNVTPQDQNLDTIIRLFDAVGNEVAIDKRKGSRAGSVSFVVGIGGVFYVGVSGGNVNDPLNFGNDAYNPLVGGSGSNSEVIGSYDLILSVSGGIGEGSVVLSSDNLSVGINSNGTLGASTAQTPTGVKLHDDEFLLLGELESYFSVIADGYIGRNSAGDSQSDLALSLVNESDFSNRRANVSGIFRNLSIKRSLSFGVNDQFVAIDVTLRNVSNQTINSLAWVEGFNPNQGRALDGGNDETINDVSSDKRLATASRNGLVFGLGAADGMYAELASFENRDSVRDPYQVINSPTDPDGAMSDQGMAMSFNLGSLVPNQSATFRYFIFVGSMSEVQTLYTTLETGTGSGHLVQDPRNLTLSAGALPYATYYPEGFASPRVNTFVPMINGNDESVRVVIIAHYETNAASEVLFDSATDSPGGVIGAGRRFGYTVTNPTLYSVGTLERVASQIPGRPGVLKRTPYALEIRSSLPIGATFSHYGQGVSTGEAFTSSTSQTWTFANLEKAAKVNDYILVYNPAGISTKVKMTVYPEAGSTQPILTSTITVASQKRGGWNFAKLLGLVNGNYAIKIESDEAIVAAVTHYDLRSVKRIGYAVIGTPNLGSLTGSTGEGELGVNAAKEVVTIVNTNTSSANVVLTFSYSTGSSFRKTIAAAGQRRTTVDLGSIPGLPKGTPFSISYESNRTVTLDLSSFAFGEGTGSAFVQQSATQWLFGEGFRQASNPTRTRDYLRVFNPSANQTQIAITIVYNTGQSEVFFRSVEPRAATNFNLHDFITGARRNSNAFFSVKVQAPTPITTFFGHFDHNLGSGFGTAGSPLGTLSTFS